MKIPADYIMMRRRLWVAERTALPGDVISRVLDALIEFWTAHPEMAAAAERLAEDDAATDEGARA